MKTAGIITIHKINNYGSVLQAYALQTVCESLGYRTQIIDYVFPNDYHRTHASGNNDSGRQRGSGEPRLTKLLFAAALLRQHRGIQRFAARNLALSGRAYNSPDELLTEPPRYDIYITGSDQLWSPRHCKGDPAFMLHFAPDEAKKISYAASMGTNAIPPDLVEQYRRLLGRYSAISVREHSACGPIKELTGTEPRVVLDPTLLLDKGYWGSVAVPGRLVKKKYILCYFLNYSFDAFPYADEVAEEMGRQTGYKIIRVARPPRRLSSGNAGYRIGASPEEFLALVRDAEMVLTTSFHGTAFAVNFGRPLFSIVGSKDDSDSRQANLLRQLNLRGNILPMNAPLPAASGAAYDTDAVYDRLSALRSESLNYLKTALEHV